MTDDRGMHGHKAAIVLPYAFWCVAGVLFLLGPVHVGFLSDDYDLIHGAAGTSWCGALRVTTGLPSSRQCSRLPVQALSGDGHGSPSSTQHICANIAMVWQILIRRLAVSRLEAGTVTFLFTLCSAGFEALAWSCALGYVLTLTIVLLGFLLLLPLDRDITASSRVRFAALQIIALLIWDWGILFFPLMALCFAFSVTHSRDISSVLRKGASLLWPSFGCWLLFLVIKASLGQSQGYSVSLSPVRSAYFLLTAPLRCTYPNGPTPLYKSPLGLSVSLCMFLALVVTSRMSPNDPCRDCDFLCLSDSVRVVRSRRNRGIFTLRAPFSIHRSFFPRRTSPAQNIRLAVVFALVVMNAVWAVDRAALWKGAYREAQRVKTAIEAQMRHRSGPIVVVNLPDRYGPENLIWRPYVWRNGLTAFNGEIIRVNTPCVPFTWDASGIPVMARSDIRKEYPDHKLIEVTYAEPHELETFRGSWHHGNARWRALIVARLTPVEEWLGNLGAGGGKSVGDCPIFPPKRTIWPSSVADCSAPSRPGPIRSIWRVHGSMRSWHTPPASAICRKTPWRHTAAI